MAPSSHRNPDAFLTAASAARLQREPRCAILAPAPRTEEREIEPTVHPRPLGPAAERGSGPRVLVLEDDPALRSVLVRGLREEEFRCASAATGAELLECVAAFAPDALVIDIGLPDADGRDVCETLRAHGVDAPVLFLTARSGLGDRLSAFSAGADDYLTKPFELDELVARLRACTRRAASRPPAPEPLLRLDLARLEVACGNRSARLTATEFRLLARLAAGAGEIVRRSELTAAAWPHGAIVHDNTLDSFVARLRRKLRTLPGAPAIEAVYGRGYVLR